MADCSCDYCSKESTCKYAYQSSDCIIDSIRDAKIVTECGHFKALYEFIESQRDTFDSVDIEIFFNAMKELKYYAEM